LESVAFGLSQLVEEAAAMVSPQAKDRGVEVRQVVEPGLPEWLMGDPQRLRQVLLNLISNAVKFSSEGAVTLRVTGGERGEDAMEVRFAVEDNGIGIPIEKQQAIFEAFTQADSSTTRRYGGTGLGLPICRQLVAAMNGDLKVESEVGRGSTFWFVLRLPSAPEQLRGAAGGERIAASARRLHVLLVDDNPVNRMVAARLIEKMGHRVTLASGGRQAVEMVEQGRFDVALMDCQMPDMDGYEAVRLIRSMEHGSGLPVIALTAHAMTEDRQRCIDAGMNGYLPKPLSPPQLFAALEAIPAGGADEGARPGVPAFEAA